MLSTPGAAVFAPAPAAVVLAHALSVGKVGRYIDTTNTTGYNIVPGLLTVAQFNAEFRPYHAVNVMV
jgi:hypothetical protein